MHNNTEEKTYLKRKNVYKNYKKIKKKTIKIVNNVH